MTSLGYKKIVCKLVNNPLDPSIQLDNSKDVVVDKIMHKRLLRRLIYLSHVKPDVAYAASTVSQFIHCLKEICLHATHRIVKYLKGTSKRGILFERNGNTILDA